MDLPPTREDEAARLRALDRYGLLDTPREPDFDEIAEAAAELCETPIAVVNLLGDGRQFFKAEVGLGVRETPLETSFCRQAMLQQDFLYVPDASRDPRFEGNPLVTGEPGLRFYAGALLGGYGVIMLNQHLTASEVTYILDDGDAQAIWAAAGYADVGRDAASDVPGVRIIGPESREWAQAKAEASATPPSSKVPTTTDLGYTSGTTGRPKGCELTHGNLLFELESTAEGLRPLFVPGSSTLLFLPLAHVLARVIQCGCVYNRVRMGHAPDIKNLLPDLGTFQPTFILSVPRVFEKVVDYFHNRFQEEIQLDSFNLRDIKFDPEKGLENLADLRRMDISLRDITESFHVPKEWIMLERTVLLLMGLCTELDPTMNPMAVIRPYLEKFVLGDDNDWTTFAINTSKDIVMKRLVIASALILSPFALAAGAEAQGTIPGAQRGAEYGNRAAGPIGGVVGGAVGAATGTVGGVLGVDPERDRREERMERREERREMQRR